MNYITYDEAGERILDCEVRVYSTVSNMRRAMRKLEAGFTRVPANQEFCYLNRAEACTYTYIEEVPQEAVVFFCMDRVSMNHISHEVYHLAEACFKKDFLNIGKYKAGSRRKFESSERVANFVGQVTQRIAEIMEIEKDKKE